MDAVFKALADPVRRAVLDRLLNKGGLSLAQLCEGHDMTRFGVMKHLRILERANLVVTRKAGRETLHYLNAVPIQQIHDRWIGKYAEAISSSMLDLRERLECPIAQPRAVGASRRKAAS